MKLPRARNKNIVTQNLGDEILIYDLNINKAYSLNQTSTSVYQNCDGKTTFAEVKAKHNFSDELIYLALEQLKKENLLEKDADFLSPFNGLSRREIVKKVGFSSMIALPVIASVIAPTAINAASGSCAPGLLAAGQTTTIVCTFALAGGCAANDGCNIAVPGFDAGAECCSGTAAVGVCKVSQFGEECACVCV